MIEGDIMNFEYRIKDNPIDLTHDNPIQLYLERLGIKKTESFLIKPELEDYLDPRLLDNMEEAVDKVHAAFMQGKSFYLQPDPDADGICSGAIFYAYFKELYPDALIMYEVQNDKTHGITLNKIPYWAETIIIVDAGSNDFEQQRTLVEQGKDVIILDHHLVDNFEQVEGTIIVNNQLSKKYTNKFLSGAGVVYKFIDLYSQKYGDGKSHERYMDLAALGLISDMMDSRDLDNNYIIYHGLKNIQNPMFQSLLNKQSYSISSITNPTKIDIAFYVTPLINAVVRVGTLDENMELFKAFAEYNNTDIFERTYRGKTTEETLYEKIAREGYNTRNRQNKTKEKVVDFLDSRIKETGIEDNAIITLVSSNTDEIKLPKTMTGLVAMDFVKRYRKPTLIMRPKTIDGVEMLFGSGRSNPAIGFSSFKDELNNSGLVEYAQGHAMAFGVGVKKDNLVLLNNYMNEHLKDIDFGSEIIEVEHAFEYETINAKALWSFARNSHLYGNMIPTPKFAFKFILNKNLVKVLGQRQTTLKFMQDNIDFIMFNAEEEIAKFTDDKDDFLIVGDYQLTVIGTPKINEFMGNTSLQISMDYLDIKKFNKFDLL